jgi:hypothetical protein
LTRRSITSKLQRITLDAKDALHFAKAIVKKVGAKIRDVEECA